MAAALLTERIGRLADRFAAAGDPPALERALRGLLIQLHWRLSTNAPGVAGGGRLTVVTPTRFSGAGRIVVEPGVVFGVVQAADAWSCSHFEARTPAALIHVGAGTVFNNRAQVISEGAGIRIGARCLFGGEVMLLDSNFHNLDVARRHLPDAQPQPLELGDDVFVGARACLLKGVRIGAGSVVAAGSVVPPGLDAPPGSIVAGNPARVVGRVPEGA